MKKYTIICKPINENLPKDYTFTITVDDDTPIEEVRDQAESIIYAQWSTFLLNEDDIWTNIIYDYTVEDI